MDDMHRFKSPRFEIIGMDMWTTMMTMLHISLCLADYREDERLQLLTRSLFGTLHEADLCSPVNPSGARPGCLCELPSLVASLPSPSAWLFVVAF